MVNKQRLIRLVRQLIKIDSQNPPGDESAVAGFVRDYLVSLGLKTKLYEYKKRRTNVVATLRGRGSSHTLLITPHLDTVPAGNGWSMPPFEGTIVGDKIYGLGATDCKGNLAVGLEALHSIIEDRVALGYTLVFAATADEESGSQLGLIPLLEKNILSCDAAVVLDSEDFDIIVVQKGLVHVKVAIRGIKAHGAYPWRGVSAIDKAVAILQDLKRLSFKARRNNYLHPPTLNIGTIQGGDKVNVVADWCEFELDFRFLPGMSAGAFLAQLKKRIRAHTGNFKIMVEGTQKPYALSASHPLVKYLSAAMSAMKVKPRLKGSEGATVITFFQDRKIPAVATGFGAQGCAHGADEFARIGTLYRGALVMQEFLKSYRYSPS